MDEDDRQAWASSVEEVEDLVDRMTLEEKVAQLETVRIGTLLEEGSFSERKARDRIPRGIGRITRVGRERHLPPAELGQVVADALVGFARTTIEPGETRTVSCTVRPSNWPSTIATASRSSNLARSRCASAPQRPTYDKRGRSRSSVSERSSRRGRTSDAPRWSEPDRPEMYSRSGQDAIY